MRARDTATMAANSPSPAVLEPLAPPPALAGGRGRLGSLAANPALVTVAALTALVLVSTAIRLPLSQLVRGPTIYPDEWIYAELARSLASFEPLEVRDVPLGHLAYGVTAEQTLRVLDAVA